MTIVQVRYVLEVARCLNISHAAKHLFVTQSALSQQIARLESELGYLLFQREVHGLRLTKEGEAFCRAAEPVLEAWTQFSQYALSLCASGRRSLRIVIGPRVYSNRLFGDIVQYFDAHPNLNVTFVTEAGRDFFADLKSGAIDLALDQLPEKYQDVVKLKYFDGYTIREISSATGMPEGTVSVYLRRAIQELRLRLKEEAVCEKK